MTTLSSKTDLPALDLSLELITNSHSNRRDNLFLAIAHPFCSNSLRQQKRKTNKTNILRVIGSDCWFSARLLLSGSYVMKCEKEPSLRWLHLVGIFSSGSDESAERPNEVFRGQFANCVHISLLVNEMTHSAFFCYQREWNHNVK